jgi:hypothetical protein
MKNAAPRPGHGPSLPGLTRLRGSRMTAAHTKVEWLAERYQGQSLNRLEDLRFLTGRGSYVADEQVPGVLHAYVLRSLDAFARIARLELEAARAMPGPHGSEGFSGKSRQGNSPQVDYGGRRCLS